MQCVMIGVKCITEQAQACRLQVLKAYLAGPCTCRLRPGHGRPGRACGEGRLGLMHCYGAGVGIPPGGVGFGKKERRDRVFGSDRERPRCSLIVPAYRIPKSLQPRFTFWSRI